MSGTPDGLPAWRRPPGGTRRQAGWREVAHRYVPVVAVVLLVTAAVVAFGHDAGQDDRTAATGPLDPEELVRSGPMTPAKAELLGEQVDFGPGCDLATGRIRLPTPYAPPCVRPFRGGNGGATSSGVTGDAVRVVAYVPANDYATSALAGADVPLDPAPTVETLEGYTDLYNRVFETYGREVELVTFRGTAASDDQEQAKADAIAIADMEPFAVVGGPAAATEAFADELSARQILCLQGCALGASTAFVEERAPYVWPDGMTADQAGSVTAEAVAKLAGPGPAALAGDPEVRDRERVYAVLYPTGEGGAETLAALRDGLAERGIDVASAVEYTLEPARAQEMARNVVARLEDAGVTTVVYTGDMLTPNWLTREATAQDYGPEWILGPNYFADTAAFARTYDQDQWGNGFGLAFKATASTSAGHAGGVYEWAYGTEPPSPIAGALEPALRTLFTGVHLAGPELTPETFRDGLFRYPPSGDGRTTSTVSWGDHGLWPDVDHGDTDDVAIAWWDARASDEEATGIAGTGLYRLANGGQRYGLGEIPGSAEEAGLFDAGSSVLMYGVDLPPSQARTDPPPGDLRER